MCSLQHDGRHVVRPAQFLGPLQGYQPTLPAPPSWTLRVPAQPYALELVSDLRNRLAVHVLDHGRFLAADDPSTSPYAANARLPMSVLDVDLHSWTPMRDRGMRYHQSTR